MKSCSASRRVPTIVALVVFVALVATAGLAFGAVTRTEDTATGSIAYTPPFVAYSPSPPNYTTNWMNYTLGADSGGSYTYTSVSGARADFPFFGTGVDWRSVKAANCGIAQVWVDGEAPTLVNLYSATTQRQQLIWSRTGLASGSHVLHIVNTGTSNPNNGPRNVGIDSFDVYTASDIVASAGSHGSISPAGTTSVDHGGSLEYTITPDSGYHVDDVLVDGASVGAVTSYQFTNVTSPRTISASFAADAPAVVSTSASAPWSLGLLALVGFSAVAVARRRHSARA